MRRGEVYWVDFDPARGGEIQKRRPAVLVSNDAAARLDASQPPPRALTRRTLVTSFWPCRIASCCSLVRRICWALTTSR